MAEKIRILSVPYDSGYRLARMGRGPVDLLDHGLADAVQSAGHRVTVQPVEHALPFPMENAVAFALHGLIANAVARSRAGGVFPLILSGNCNYAAIGSVTGLGAAGTGVLWFDAHGESETPETSESAFLDGMGLAMLVGACWTRALSEVPGFAPIEPGCATLVGARDLSEGEYDFIPRHRIGMVSVEAIRTKGARALADELGRLKDFGVKRLYVHIDADVYDPDEAGHANAYSATAGAGLTAGEVTDCLEGIATAVPIHAAAITAYDPAIDTDGRMRTVLIDLARLIARLGVV